MSSRKEMPDVLGDILGGVRSYPSLADAAEPAAAGPAAASAGTAPPAQTIAAPVPAAPADPAPPPAWEYREVIFRDYRGWRTRVVNGRELGDWKQAPTAIEYLEQAGKEGWELVSMSDRHNNQKEAYLKRPKP
jgi:hypothetical protein